MTFFLPLNKRNTPDKAKGFSITSERPIGELGVRCLSTLKMEDRTRGSSIKLVWLLFFIFVVEYAISIKTHTTQP